MARLRRRYPEMEFKDALAARRFLGKVRAEHPGARLVGRRRAGGRYRAVLSLPADERLGSGRVGSWGGWLAPAARRHRERGGGSARPS
jgi:hypothetical protein